MMRAEREMEGGAGTKRWRVASFSCAAALLGAACAPPVETSIRTAPADERNALLQQAIHDAGYLCDELIDATSPAGVAAGWRVLCADMLVYVVSLDAADALHIEPIPYGDPVTPPGSRNPADEAETVLPDP
jgi:hypothetical protein